MKALRNLGTLSVLGLVLLGLLAAILSALALTRFGTVEAAPAPSSVPLSSPTTSSASAEQSASAPAASASATVAVSSPPPSSAAPVTGPTVVVVGDSYSLGEPSDTWLGSAAEELGWGKVVNLSSPGRGFITAPRSCEFEPCDMFVGTVSTIAEAEPDVVVTFGGNADGDYSLADAAAEYFAALRQALPEAAIVALSPVTTEDPAPYFLTLHSRTIRAGVEAVDGTFVDVGQPGVGDGETLSGEAQAEIAQQVIDQLQ